MVFFNYSRMQMSAKIVYYGPGLCGKTTNLHWIYSHTAGDSRGEMVSLETETDRTLFFDLLPIDVGTIGGFETRLQLYTVPGQVFYNTTRKLVLKGVDGVVFVADSQKPMLQANIDAFRNLEENLAEMGLSVDSLPLVLQYNKRDLDDILPVSELNAALNRNNWAYFESSAVSGQGVLETLKGVSKLTLLALRQRLSQPDGAPSGAPSGVLKKTGAGQSPAPAAPARPAASAAAPSSPAAARVPGAKTPEAAPAKAAPPSAPPQPAPPSHAARPAPPESTAPPMPGATVARTVSPPRRNLDALSELERLRKATMRSKPAGAPPRRAGNGHHGGTELFRDIQFTLKRADFNRARRFSLTLSVEDEERQVVEAVRGLEVEIDNPADLDKILLKLNIALRQKD